MSIASAKKIEQISQGDDPKQAIIDAVGDLSGVEVFTDLVLVGTFIRNERTKGGLILPPTHLQEDEFQGKVGLVLKSGPIASGDWETGDEIGQNAEPGTWVVFAIKDTWPVQINGAPCRFVPYDKLRARLDDPKAVF